MRIKTTLKAGHIGGSGYYNHNQTAVRSSNAPRVKTSLRASDGESGRGGCFGFNHNQTAVRAVRVKSSIKAGLIGNGGTGGVGGLFGAGGTGGKG